MVTTVCPKHYCGHGRNKRIERGVITLCLKLVILERAEHRARDKCWERVVTTVRGHGKDSGFLRVCLCVWDVGIWWIYMWKYICIKRYDGYAEAWESWTRQHCIPRKHLISGDLPNWIVLVSKHKTARTEWKIILGEWECNWVRVYRYKCSSEIVQFKIVSMCCGKPTCAPSSLLEATGMLPLFIKKENKQRLLKVFV